MLNFFDTNKKTLPQQVKANKEDIEMLKADVKITPKGEFNENTLYKRFDVVTYAPTNNTYICIVEGSTTISGILPTDSTRWCLYTLGGLQGAQGTPGEDAEITPASINDVLEGSEYISVDFNEQSTKLQIELDKTNVETIEATEDSAKLITSGAVFDTVSNKQNQIIDSADIIQDTAEDKLYINNNLKNKINNALLTPTDAPLAPELVAVDETNAQKMLGIGEGLYIEDDLLKASASGGKLYEHNIECTIYTQSLTIKLINEISEPFSVATLKEYLSNNGWTGASVSDANYYPLHILNYSDAAGRFTLFQGIYFSTSTDKLSLKRRTQTLTVTINDDNTATINSQMGSGVADLTSFTDVVIEL